MTSLDDVKLSAQAKTYLVNSINDHEGFQKFMYLDSEGHWTIGYGYNLSANGIPREVAALLRDIKVEEAYFDLCKNFPGFLQLSEQRQIILIEMVYQMGITGVLKFTKFIKACVSRNYIEARKEMLDSDWGRKYTARANVLAHHFEIDSFPGLNGG